MKFKNLFKPSTWALDKKSSGGAQPLSFSNNLNDLVTIDPLTSKLIYSSSYIELSKAGYIENVIANACIRRIADTIKNMPIGVLADGEPAIESTDRNIRGLLNTIREPSTDYSWKFFVESVIKYRYLGGRGYMHPKFSEITGEPIGIEFFRPDRMSIIQSQDERIFSYRYSKGSTQELFERDEDGYFDLIDWRQFHPTSDTEGLSSISPAGLSIDAHTEGSKFNKQVMENSGKPSMIVSLVDKENSIPLNEDQFRQLQESINKALNVRRGGAALINAPVKVDVANMSPLELDFINGIKMKATEICLALDFPPYLLGFEGATFSNQEEARLALYEDCAMPKYEELLDLLSSFYSRKLDRNIEFFIKKDKIIALASRFKQHQDIIVQRWEKGLITRDNALEDLNIELVGGLDGDAYFQEIQKQIMNQTEG